MAQSNCSILDCLPETAEPGKSRMKGIAGLLAAVLIIGFFMFYAGPRLSELPMVKPMVQFIDERGIEANMYFYTEVEEFSEAGINMTNTMAYPPGKDSPKAP